MPIHLSAASPFGSEITRVAGELIDESLSALDQWEGETAPDRDIRTALRAADRARSVVAMVRAEGTKEGRKRVDRPLRAAGDELSALSKEVLATEAFERLVAAGEVRDDDALAVGAALADEAHRARSDGEAVAEHLTAARSKLTKARRRLDKWDLSAIDEWSHEGMTRAYRKGRRWLAQELREPNKTASAKWASSATRLGAQLELLSGQIEFLQPVVDDLDTLGEMARQVHDAGVLVERIRSDHSTYGGKKTVKRVARLARAVQRAHRAKAIALAASVYAEEPQAFAKRIEAARETGCLQPLVGTGSATVSPCARKPVASRRDIEEVGSTARRFLVPELPDLPLRRDDITIGYLSVDDRSTTRIEDAGPDHRTLVMTTGTQPQSVEFRASLNDPQFDAAWPGTNGRRVHKTRYVLADHEQVIDLSVYLDELDGLVLACAAFDSPEHADEWRPPAWLGDEVTGDPRFLDLSLAVDGLDPELLA